MNKTMTKLVWSMAVIVLIVGMVKAAMVYASSQDTDRNILILKSKQK